MVMMIRIPFGVPLWQEALSVALSFGTRWHCLICRAKSIAWGILMYGKKTIAEGDAQMVEILS